ncbi:hypothetical protein HMPREF9124_2059 [Oribacterium sp. oral taxon 108 str. F0425]|nr:hypothetical protein HMPREF9124_2059 [Oribacterium sp. oral taxon 108 str. F0425]
MIKGFVHSLFKESRRVVRPGPVSKAVISVKAYPLKLINTRLDN